MNHFGHSRQPYRRKSNSKQLKATQNASLQRNSRFHRPGDRYLETCAKGRGHRGGELQGTQRLSRQAGEGLQNQKEPYHASKQELERGAGVGGAGLLHGRGRGALQHGGGPLGGARERRRRALQLGNGSCRTRQAIRQDYQYRQGRTR